MECFLSLVVISFEMRALWSYSISKRKFNRLRQFKRVRRHKLKLIIINKQRTKQTLNICSVLIVKWSSRLRCAVLTSVSMALCVSLSYACNKMYEILLRFQSKIIVRGRGRKFDRSCHVLGEFEEKEKTNRRVRRTFNVAQFVGRCVWIM